MQNSDRPVEAGSGSRALKGLALELDASRGSPLSSQIAEGVVRAISQGRLRPGNRLPGSRRLATELSVHRNTVLAGYAQLTAGGWIECRAARGTFVSTTLPRPRPLTASPRHSPPEPGFTLGRARVPRERAIGSALDLSGAHPDLDLVPAALIARAYRRALRLDPKAVLGYGDCRGHARLREAIAQMLVETRGLTVTADDVLVTRGSQMAIELVSRVLSRPGDLIAVEGLGYPPAWEALARHGAQLEAVPVDAQGLVVERLEALADRTPLRAVYVTPHHQYPTAVTLSGPRRLALLDLARRKRFAIIEDDHAHEFHYRGRPLLPMASADEAGVVLYVGTLSKVLSPGLRTGYLVAPRAVLEQAADERRTIDRQGDLPTELALSELLEDGEVGRHCRRMRRVYRDRRDAMLAALDRHLRGALSAPSPAGGMALWARVSPDIDLDAWLERAQQAGLLVHPARHYALDRRPRRALRLSFSGRSEQASESALKRLAACL